MVNNPIFKVYLLCCSLMPAGIIHAEQVLIAVASNFSAPMTQLIQVYEQRSNDRVAASYASTGTLYAQIRHGAPFDIYLAADKHRPQALEKEGLIIKSSRVTYARGRLVLWSTDDHLIKGNADVLHGDFKHLALANFRTAPYGLAAKQVLEKLKLYNRLRPRFVMGENVGQTYQYIASGAAELGFVALSQVQPGKRNSGSYWLVPADMHEPIEQQMVLLNKKPASQAFYDFLLSNKGREIIRQYGYVSP